MTAALTDRTVRLKFRTRVRALFISDVHLGTRSAQALRLLQFLKQYEADTIYLVGDIIDFWKVRRGPHWVQSHNDVLQKLMRRVRKGTRLVYIPGNHDEGLRDYLGLHFGGMEIHRAPVHHTADGRRCPVLPGDEVDVRGLAARHAVDAPGEWGRLSALDSRQPAAAAATIVPLPASMRGSIGVLGERVMFQSVRPSRYLWVHLRLATLTVALALLGGCTLESALGPAAGLQLAAPAGETHAYRAQMMPSLSSSRL